MNASYWLVLARHDIVWLVWPGHHLCAAMGMSSACPQVCVALQLFEQSSPHPRNLGWRSCLGWPHQCQLWVCAPHPSPCATHPPLGGSPLLSAQCQGLIREWWCGQSHSSKLLPKGHLLGAGGHPWHGMQKRPAFPRKIKVCLTTRTHDIIFSMKHEPRTTPSTQ